MWNIFKNPDRYLDIHLVFIVFTPNSVKCVHYYLSSAISNITRYSNRKIHLEQSVFSCKFFESFVCSRQPLLQLHYILKEGNCDEQQKSCSVSDQNRSQS